MKLVRSIGLVALVASALVLGACEGDTGPPGPAGPEGPQGPQGDPGDPGTAAGLPVESADRINVEVTSIDAPTDGSAPTVSFKLTNDLGQGLTGLPDDNISFVISQLSAGVNGSASEWQAYTTNSRTNPPDVQAGYESATVGDYDDVGDGTFTYTFAQDLPAYSAGPTFDPGKIHRVGLEIRTERGTLRLGYDIPHNNAPTDFRPPGTFVDSTDPDHRLIVDNDTCNACHDNLEFHGGARFDIEYCVTCHNPYSIDPDTAAEPWGGTVDMTEMIHKIHRGYPDVLPPRLVNGYFIIGYGGTLHDYGGTVVPPGATFSQDPRNCTTCHDETDTDSTPQASNYFEVVTRRACGACHDDIDWDAGGHPGGVVFPDDSLCLDCHGPDSTVSNGALQVKVVHTIPEKVASGTFEYNILSISNTGIGETPVVEFSVTDPTNGDAPYDIQNDSEWTTCDFGASRLAIGIAWDTDDYTSTGSGRTPGQPISMNPLTGCGGTSTAVGGGVFSVTSPIAIPATASGTLAVTIDGHPAVVIDGTAERIAVTNAIDYATITDTTVVERRNAVAIERCNDCHNQLAIHGNNRTDNIEVCVTCHNPNATDINRRVGECATELGTDDVSVDMKYMIHALHAGGATGVPYDVCGFGFPSTPHTYEFAYPGKLNNCEGCHKPGGYYPVDPSEVLGTTVSVGADPATPVDDTVVSPNTAVCSACHVSSLAAEHMQQNGGDFNAMKAADSTLISSGVETCELCHGPGRSVDVAEVHGVGDFRFNPP